MNLTLPPQTDPTRQSARKTADLGGGVPGSPAAQRPATPGDLPAPPQATSGQIQVTRQPNGVAAFSGGNVTGQPAYEGAKAAGFSPRGGTVNSMPAQNFASASPSADAAVGFARSAAVARGEPVQAGGGGFGFSPSAARAPQPAQPAGQPAFQGGFDREASIRALSDITSPEYRALRSLKMDAESEAEQRSRMGRGFKGTGAGDAYAALVGELTTGTREGQLAEMKDRTDRYGTDQREAGANARAALGEQGSNSRAALTAGIQFGELDLKRQALGQRKDAPSGYRWTETGDLAAIPGGPGDRKVTDKLTEDQAKSAGYAARMANAMNLLDSIGKSNPGATRPGAGTALLNMLPESAANLVRNDDRQRVEAAQLDALDAALTLNTGAAYTREQLQGMQRSYFAQPGDSDQTVAEKQQRLANLVETARLRAGPQGSQMADAVVQAQKPAQAAPNAPAVSPEIAELQRRAANNPALRQRLKEMGY